MGTIIHFANMSARYLCMASTSMGTKVMTTVCPRFSRVSTARLNHAAAFPRDQPVSSVCRWRRQDGQTRRRAVDCQYANGHTPYGPIEAGEGRAHFTLRQYWDRAQNMPQSSGKLRKGNQRTRRKGNIPVGAQSTQSGVSGDCFPLESDGLTASLCVGADTQFGCRSTAIVVVSILSGFG